jgi:hypothetical protein
MLLFDKATTTTGVKLPPGFVNNFSITSTLSLDAADVIAIVIAIVKEMIPLGNLVNKSYTKET